MKDNIYDVTISELILRLDAATASLINTSRLVITSTLGIDTAPENSNNAATFTSTIVNLPSGWTVVASSHIMSYPVTPDDTGSNTELVGGSVNVILGAAGTDFTVTSTVDITDGSTTLTLNGSLVITAVLPIYYGVKAVPVGNPTSVGLSEISSEQDTFTMTTSINGRIYVAIPTASNGADFKGLQDPNGLFIPLTDFVQTVVGSYYFYYTTYDTLLTGAQIKTFLIVYNATGTLNPALPTI